MHNLQLIRKLTDPLGLDHVVSIGNFDGVHLGHQKILTNLIEKSNCLKLPSLVIIFEPQPMEFFLQQSADARITTLRNKLTIFKNFHIDKVLCLQFNNQLANINSQQFIEQILITKLRTKHLVIGDDFAFGKNRTGGYELLQKYHNFFTLETLPTLHLNSHRISSSHIRQALAVGDIELANKMLGRKFTMAGHVAHGDRRGHQLGYPTANIYIKNRILPLTGIFAVKILGLKTIHYGIANIGIRPTFADATRNVLEVHIFGFNEDIYGQNITIEYLKKIREETKFSSWQTLKQQIQKDIAKTTTLLHNMRPNGSKYCKNVQTA